MNAFVSHNKVDKETARLLAAALVGQGVSVWFDEWDLQPGDSMTGGIQAGLERADAFVLVWSEAAARSRWVGSEVAAYIRRRIDDESLRLVPLMLDDTPLPVLVADYKGFELTPDTSLDEIAHQIAGKPADIEIAQVLQSRLRHLTLKNVSEHDPLPYLVCPSCGSANLQRGTASDPSGDEHYYMIDCPDCGWGDWSQ
ncbi:MAG: toll/interleukin-1 receptor domain-containing protein [Haloechinothrix sp.]